MDASNTAPRIYVEQAQVLSQQRYPGEQYYLRLLAPKTATHAQPGQFVHMQCPGLNMRRPMSIMRAMPAQKTIDVLYKVHGHGTRLLSQSAPGAVIDLLGPIGNAFTISADKKRPLLIGGGVGIPPVIFLAEQLKKTHSALLPLVVMGSELPFPFTYKPSQLMTAGIPNHVIAAMPLLDDLGIPSRLASGQDYAGCFNGYVTELAALWLQSLNQQQREQVAIFSCGPLPMLTAVAQLAKQYDVPCQVALEEYMACAVGGCAGCSVLIQTTAGPKMQRVCVDGPVFNAEAVIALQQ